MYSENAMKMTKGDLILPKDGNCTYITDITEEYVLGLSSSRNERFVGYRSIPIKDIELSGEAIDVIHSPHPDIIIQALSHRVVMLDEFKEWSKQSSVTETNNTTGSHKPNLRSGVTIVDRYGKAYLILHVDDTKAYVFRYGTYKTIDLSEFRDNLKHRHARLGIRCYFYNLAPAALAMALNVEYLSNRYIDQFLVHNGVDLRTDKDKGILRR